VCVCVCDDHRGCALVCEESAVLGTWLLYDESRLHKSTPVNTNAQLLS